MKRMVASEEYFHRITRLLSLNGFKYIYRLVREKDLLGSLNEVLLIHASSPDDKTILTIRMPGNDLNRLRITVKGANEDMRERLELLEDKGFNIYEDDEEVSAVGRFPTNTLIDALREVLNLVK